MVCLQELKAADTEFPPSAIGEAGYGAVWRGQPAWNGVAILARGVDPVLTRDALPGDPRSQSRYIEAAVGGVLVASLYAPNGNPQPGPKFDYKLAWHERLSHAAELLETGLPVVLAGDYNVVPNRATSTPRSYDGDALLQPESRRLSAGSSTRAGRMRCAGIRATRLYFLGLPPQPLGAKCRPSSRPCSAQPQVRASSGSGGRPGGARAGECQRPRACLDRDRARGTAAALNPPFRAGASGGNCIRDGRSGGRRGMGGAAARQRQRRVNARWRAAGVPVSPGAVAVMLRPWG